MHRGTLDTRDGADATRRTPSVFTILTALPALWAAPAVLSGEGNARVEPPAVCGTTAPGAASLAALAIEPGTRSWECIPGVIRNDGVDSFHLEVNTGGPVTRVEFRPHVNWLIVAGAGPYPAPSLLHDDGVDGDRMAGDSIYTVGPIRTWPNLPDLEYYHRDPNSPEGIDNDDFGEVTITDAAGTTSFVINPQIGLLRASIPSVQTVQLSSAVQASAHFINVRSDLGVAQRTLRNLYTNDVPTLTYAIYSVLPDYFDFIVFHSTFRLERVVDPGYTGLVNGTYITAKRMFTGTGGFDFDNSFLYGSAGRLQGLAFIDLHERGIGSYTVTHELLHQWGAYIDASFGVSDGSHYSHLSSARSLLGGAIWVDLGDGTFFRDCSEGRRGAGAFHAGPIDLYMMGLIEGSEVLPLYSSTPEQYGCDAVIQPPYTTVTIEEIQARHGVRSPGPAGAQRDFHIGFAAESSGRFLNATEMTYYDILSSHYTKELPASEPDPFVGLEWQPITRFFGHGTTWRSDVPPPKQPEEVIIDDGDLETDAFGTWRPSAGPNPYGTGSLYSQQADASYVFRTPLIPGTYEVFLWWTEYASRPTSVPVDVVHAGGTTTVFVNQRTDGGQWNSLGVFAFPSSGMVTIRSLGNGSTCADAVRIAPAAAPPEETVIDDGDPGTAAVGSWQASGGADPYGTGSLYSKQAGATYSYTAALSPGTYEVFLWWTEYASRPTSVPVDIVHAGGTTTVSVNQRTDGGQWNSVGVYTFGAGGTITIRSTGNGSTCADAVRIAPATAPEPEETVIDDGDPGTAAAGSWLPSGGADPYGTGSLYSNQAGASYSYTASLSPGTYRVFLWWTQFASRATSVPVDIVHAGGMTTVSVNQRTDGGQWNSVGVYTFGTSGKITIRSLGNGSTCADAVRIAPSSVPAQTVIDDGDPGTLATGSWLPSGGAEPYGTGSLYSKQAGATYGYTSALVPGKYEVFLWWTEYASRPTSVPVDIVHANGTSTVFVNQRTDGGQWNSVGIYTFGTSGRVTIRSLGSGSTCADAVRIVEED